MHTVRLPVVATAIALLWAPSVFSQQSLPHHCTAGESVLLTAKMKRVLTSPQGLSFRDTGKVLSLCADSARDPVGRLSYRFGPIGTVEMDQAATRAAPFGMHAQQTGPRMSQESYFFSKGDYTYYVTVAGGMASGVGLVVYQGNKKIVDLFSGNDPDVDFQVSATLTGNAVMTQRKPRHALD